MTYSDKSVKGNSGVMKVFKRLSHITRVALTALLALVVITLPSCKTEVSYKAPNAPIHQMGMGEVVQLLSEVALPTYKIVAGTWTGSATAVNANTLLSAAHVVLNDDGSVVSGIYAVHNVPANGFPTRVFPLKVVKADRAKDLAVLESFDTLPVLARVIPRGDISVAVHWGAYVVSSGHSAGVDEPVLGFGYINSLNDDGYIRHTALSLPGNSGGGVYAFFDGHYVLVSVLQAGYAVGAPQAHMALGSNPFTTWDYLYGADGE